MGNKQTRNDIDAINAVNRDLVELAVGGTDVTIDTAIDGSVNVTKLTFTYNQATTNANLALGKKVLTFPKGVIHVHNSYIDISAVAGGAYAVTPEVGIGTVVASGAINTFAGATATFDDISTGAAMTIFNGTTPAVTERVMAGQLDIKDGTTTAVAVFFNLAGAWASVAALVYTCTITLVWSNLTAK